MTATTRHFETTAATPTLFVAFELGETTWKLAFTTGMGQRPRERSVSARDRAAVVREIERAKQRFGVAAETEGNRPDASTKSPARSGFPAQDRIAIDSTTGA